MANNYLNKTGLSTLWSKIKSTFALKSDIPDSTSDLTNDSGFITIDHSHTYDDLVSTSSKTFSGVLATSSDVNTLRPFFRVIPTDWDNTVMVGYRYKAYVPGYESQYMHHGECYFVFFHNTVIAYSCKNFIGSTSYRPIYYNSVMRCNSSYKNLGHLVGINFYNAGNSYSRSCTTSTYARTFEVEIMQMENCTVEWLDTLDTVASSVSDYVAETTHTAIVNYNGTTQGETHSGDQNSNTIATGYCTTDASTAAKVASCNYGYRGDTNYFPCLFRYANTAADATLAISSYATTALPIYVNGERTSSSNTFSAGVILFLYHNNAYYCYNDGRFPVVVNGEVTSLQDAYALKTDIPDSTSDLTNDSGFITSSSIPHPDWNENDSTSANYIANRICYTGNVTMTEVASGTLEAGTGEGEEYIWRLILSIPIESLNDGDPCIVILDETTYNLTLSFENDYYTFTEENETFSGYIDLEYQGVVIQFPNELTNDVSCSVSVPVTMINKIDNKYIDGLVFKNGTGLLAYYASYPSSSPEDASGFRSFAIDGIASNDDSVAIHGTASGYGSFADSYGTASGSSSHADSEGNASGSMSHADSGGTASGFGSHADSYGTASENHSHADSYGTASGLWSHAHSRGTASGYYSSASGLGSISNHKSQHVFGEYNIADTSTATESKRGNYVEIVGNGTKDSARSNARTLDWNGNEVLAGKLTVGTAPTANMDVATKQYVDNNIPNSTSDLTNDSGFITSSDITQSDWAENDSTSSSYIQNRTHYVDGTTATLVFEYSGTVSSSTEISDSTSGSSYDEGLEDGIEYSFTLNGTTYTGNVLYDSSYGWIIGNFSIIDSEKENTGESFCVQIGDSWWDIFLQEAYTGDLTASLSVITENVHKLDNKYIDGLVFKSGTGKKSYYLPIGSSTQENSSGERSIAIGGYASGDYSYADSEGTASGNTSHADTAGTASGETSHADSAGTASGSCSHADSWGTATAYWSHADSGGTASGMRSHADSGGTASGWCSSASGFDSIANHKSQHVFGEYNIADTSTETALNRGKYVEIVGNGTKDSARSNARTLDWSGNEVLAGKLTVGSAPTADMDVATKKYVDDNAGGVGTLSISSNVITLTSGGTTSSVTLPVYTGGVS